MTKKVFLSGIAIFGWFAIIAQFYLLINSGAAAKSELFIRFFSYFTIDTNIIVALYSTLLLLNPNSSLGRFFSKQTSIAAIAVYIVIVGVVYNIILRFLWNPRGMQLLVDELLHLIIPILFLLYWLICTGKNQLKWKNAFSWMLYPLIYGSIVLIRGYFSNPPFYPYPFIDISKLGVNQGIINTIGFTVIFFVTSLLFIGAGKLMSRKA